MYEKYTIYKDSIQLEKNNFSVIREVVKNDFELKLQVAEQENEKEKVELKKKQLNRTFGIILLSIAAIVVIVIYYTFNLKKHRRNRDDLLEEIKLLKKNPSKELIVDSNKFELTREKLEDSIGRKLNETDWKVLNILLDDPVVTNKEIAQRAFLSVDGIGSSLRRMYEYFDIKESKYKKISLLLEGIKISNGSETNSK